MRATLGTFLLSAAAVAGAGPAQAADIGVVELPPIYEPVPEVLQPVEIGSGWYLRGDVSYDLKAEFDGDYRLYVPGFGYQDQHYDDWTIDRGFDFSAGAGYQFTDFFRGDLTAHYWKHDLVGSDRFETCHEATDLGFNSVLPGCSLSTTTTGEARAWELMANAYVDLGTFIGFTPYVGGGVGAVHLRYDNVQNRHYFCDLGGSECSPAGYEATNHDRAGDWRFAYALMAGATYDMTRNLKLDVGYRYLDVAEGDMYAFDATSIANGATGVMATDEGFSRHTVQAGLRYHLW